MGFPMRKLTLIISLFITACGGGGGSTPSSPTVATEIFPDMRPIYSQMCGNSTLIQAVVPVDLNNDGKTDLLLDAWCDLTGLNLASFPVGSTYNGPIKNTAIALLQQNDGTFIIGNKQIFGYDTLAFEGSWSNPIIGDFNNDGKPDIAVSNSMEDGRTPVTYSNGTSNMDAHVQVLLSSPTTYQLYSIGTAGASINLSVVKDSQNRDMLLFGDVAWVYNNGWNSITYNTPTVSLTQFISNNINFMAGEILDNSTLGISLYQQINNLWSQIDAYTFANTQYVTVYDPKYGANYNTQQLLTTINGVDWLIPSIEDGCMIRKGATNTFAVMFQGLKMNTRYVGQQLNFSDSNLGTYISMVLLVDIMNGRITNVSATNMQAIGYFSIQCIDMNNDSSTDIVINRWLDGGTLQPDVYMNKSTTFSQTQVLTSNTNNYKGTTTVVTDLYKTNNPVVIYYPLLGLNPNYTGDVRLMLYKNNNNWN